MKKLKQVLLALSVGIATHAGFANTAPATPETAKAVATATQTSPAATQTQHLLNINTAGAAEIQDKLNGIGAKKAQAIVEYREKHGKFLNVEQLMEVPGIGKATLEKNRDKIIIE